MLLGYALYNATKYVCSWYLTFVAYLAMKRAEGKQYNATFSMLSRNWFG